MPKPKPALKSSDTGMGTADIPVVGIGASAGGLKAFIQLLEAVPENAGMAFVLIQHLSPDHESLMSSLLRAKTHMVVRQLDEDMTVERDCVYVNAPARDVILSGNRFIVTERPASHSPQLPFDFFLVSLALERGSRAMCVVLSGSGQDGTRGLKAVKRAGGFVIAQDLADAEADGMPGSAVQTGDVDAVLPAGKIPAALMNCNGVSKDVQLLGRRVADEAVPAWLIQIIQILLERTGTDFSLYKPGTLVRRITRRMSTLSSTSTQGDDYVKLLLSSPRECEALAADLLINVTRFFRDAQVFDLLEQQVIPDLVRAHRADRPLRVWVAGCSSGEEAWSLAMLLREAIDADGRNIRLQILASDIDPDAISAARTAVYAKSISGDVSAERLARFFTVEERGYRVRDELRAHAVFTVQNLLSDPPFARLDLVSCRNVMIYLGPEAQTKIMSHFQFALVTGGGLLLGTSETAGDVDGRFEIVSKPARVYRRLGRSWPAGKPIAEAGENSEAEPPRFLLQLDPTPDVRYADVCRRAVAQHYTPASVLVRRQGECLHFLGAVDQFLDVPAGSASLEILPMVPLSHRSALRSAIAAVGRSQEHIQLTGMTTLKSGALRRFNTDVRFAPDEGEELVLITFSPAPDEEMLQDQARSPDENRNTLRLGEIAGLRDEIDHTSRLLERALETERKTRRESLRLNEEYQSTNEELVTSKEELQALNEELMVLNSQLQETVERQRTSSNDLTNVLFSTNVATIFLDQKLCIRFFTPATKTVFGVITTDVGRPLGDLRSLALDKHLLDDAESVLKDKDPIEREVATPDGTWFLRRILPYRTHTDDVEGVVITYVNVMDQHRATETLKSAIRHAEHAVISKTRFLASASHDLRQPLQTLAFVQNLLSRDAATPESRELVNQMDQAVNAMSGMLNTMLDINQIEAGVITYQIEDIPVSTIMSNLYTEFAYHAQAKSLTLRMAPSSAIIRTDYRLLEQMMRNLLSNAIRYTDSGGILFGCRRRKDKLRIEIWDTGIGISEDELPNVFGEYHKVNSRGRAASEGIGLGLSIVQRLADLLGHHIHVRSVPGSGSMFSIEVQLADHTRMKASHMVESKQEAELPGEPLLHGKILITEDEADLRKLLARLIVRSGHAVSTAASFDGALSVAAQPGEFPDILVADFNLPQGRNGIELAKLLRHQSVKPLPVIILTGDISAATTGLINAEGFTALNKPVRPERLEQEIQRLLIEARDAPSVQAPPTFASAERPQVIIVDDDLNFCETLSQLLQADGLRTASFPSGEAFLAVLDSICSANEPVCAMIDAYLGGLSGFDVLDVLKQRESAVMAIMITGNSDVRMAVQAMKAGALDFIEKPIDVPSLRGSIDQALATGRDAASVNARRADAASRLSKLTAREREVLDRILSGQPNKNIAADLGISQRTVESHRASVMLKSGCRTLPALVRLAVRAN